MQPNNDKDRSISIPQRQSTGRTTNSDRELASKLMREQIDRLYDEQPTQHQQVEQQIDESHRQQETQTTAQSSNPYDQTQSTEPGAIQKEQWDKYHTAWQQYYQQYYQRYYETQQRANQSQAQQQTRTSHFAPTPNESVTKDQAVDDIRSDLLGKVKQSTDAVRKSRHFVPILSALVVMSLFLFLQYNRLIFAQAKAYVSPGSISAQNIILDPTTDVKVSKEPRIIIPKINVDAPNVYGLDSLSEGVVQNALKDGVVHYPIPGASSVPGQAGNSVFLGHSSNDVFDDGDYKFVFVQLEKIKKGDTFYINYQGTRYTYSVTGTEVVLPSEVNKLVTDDNKPTATLVSCVPVGTADKRLLVRADQISPNPADVKARSDEKAAADPPKITGNSPTLFERLFGS